MIPDSEILSGELSPDTDSLVHFSFKRLFDRSVQSQLLRLRHREEEGERSDESPLARERAFG